MIKSIYDFDFGGFTALVRVDFNVPLTETGEVSDDTRIIETLPTIDKIIDDGGIPVLISHLGRPKGTPNPKFSLLPVAKYMNQYLGYNVKFAPDCIAPETIDLVKRAVPGEVILCENLRFYKGEEENSEDFARKLRQLGDVYVNDAFATCHRAHASVDRAARLFENRFAGKLLLNELFYLGKAIENPARPFTSIIGGAKITGKIDVIRNLFEKCDNILIGGGLSYTFLRAKGFSVGSSLVEEEKIDLARELIEEAEKRNINLVLPVDVVVARAMDNNSDFQVVKSDQMPEGWMGFDIGPETRGHFEQIILNSKTIVWNGPVGVFEIERFSEGTRLVANAMAKANSDFGAITVVGGGDTASAVAKLNLKDKFSHVSTGGGASLDFLAGKELPGVKALETDG